MRVDIEQYPLARISTGGGGGLATASSTVHCYAVVQMLRQEGPLVEFQGFHLLNFSITGEMIGRDTAVWAMNENNSLLYRFPFGEDQLIGLEPREECIQHFLEKGDEQQILDHTISWYQELPGYDEGHTERSFRVVGRRQVMACNNWDIDFPAVVQEPLS